MLSLSVSPLSSPLRWSPSLPASSLSRMRAAAIPLPAHWTRRPGHSRPQATAAEAPTLYTVRQFAQCERAFTELALRNLIFKAQPRHSSKGVVPGNGLLEAGAIVRVQRKVLIHRERFLAWVQQ